MVTKLERENNTIFYLHNAWANSPDGTAGFTLEESADAAYIGNCISMSSAEVLNPSSYNWIAVEFEAVEESDTAELTELGEDVPEDPEDEDDDYSYDDYMDGAIQSAALTATTAQESADIAQQKAEEATASAALAQQKAEEATASAAEAKTAADTAKEKAEAATTDAATAKQKAEEATSSAALAQQKAESATAAAGVAHTAAESATSDARAAGIAAATAQAAAEAAQGDIDDQKKYFYHDKLGAHVLDPAGGKFRTDINANGMRIVLTDKETAVATFADNRIELATAESDYSIAITSSGIEIKNVSGQQKTAWLTPATLHISSIICDGIVARKIDSNEYGQYQYYDSTGNRCALELITSDTGTAKATTGSVAAQPTWWRCGNLVQMEFRVAATAAVNPGKNIATGTITGIPRPVTTTGLRAVSYYGDNANVSFVSQNGDFTVRNCGNDALAKGNDAIGIFTYITDGEIIGGSGSSTGAQPGAGA